MYCIDVLRVEQSSTGLIGEQSFPVRCQYGCFVDWLIVIFIRLVNSQQTEIKYST